MINIASIQGNYVEATQTRDLEILGNIQTITNDIEKLMRNCINRKRWAVWEHLEVYNIKIKYVKLCMPIRKYNKETSIYLQTKQGKRCDEIEKKMKYLEQDICSMCHIQTDNL